MLPSLIFAFQVIGPVVVLLGLGYVLYKRKLVGDAFVETGSRLVFSITLPALLFTAISKTSFTRYADSGLLLIGLSGTLVFVAILSIVSHYAIKQNAARGVVIQGGFRANMGIIGLAFCTNAFGDEGLTAGAVYLGVITLLFNVLSVLVLSLYRPEPVRWQAQVTSIVTNPLILAILAALPFSYYSLAIPVIISDSLNYLARLTLPLALLCTGASLTFSAIKRDAVPLSIAIVSKCVAYPMLLGSLAYLAGYRDLLLGVIVLMSIAPTAAASFVMARQLGGDARLAANIIALTTLLSLPVTAIVLTLLSTSGLLATQ